MPIDDVFLNIGRTFFNLCTWPKFARYSQFETCLSGEWKRAASPGSSTFIKARKLFWFFFSALQNDLFAHKMFFFSIGANEFKNTIYLSGWLSRSIENFCNVTLRKMECPPSTHFFFFLMRNCYILHGWQASYFFLYVRFKWSESDSLNQLQRWNDF